MVIAVAPGARQAGPAVFTWNGSEYVRAGQPVPAAAVRQAVDAVIARSGERVKALSGRLVARQTSLAEFQTGMVAELKALHVAVGTVAGGGVAHQSPATYGMMGHEIRGQYEFLRGFVADLASGRQPLDGRVGARAQLYSEAARGTGFAIEAQAARLRGEDQERWQLRASESCSGCVSRAAQGWQERGVLPGFGSQPCRSRCRCQLSTRRAS